jgi:adenylate cyclase
MAEFGMVLEINKDEKAAQLQLQRCQHYLTNPPESEWDGAFTMTSK